MHESKDGRRHRRARSPSGSSVLVPRHTRFVRLYRDGFGNEGNDNNSHNDNSSTSTATSRAGQQGTTTRSVGTDKATRFGKKRFVRLVVSLRYTQRRTGVLPAAFQLCSRRQGCHLCQGQAGPQPSWKPQVPNHCLGERFTVSSRQEQGRKVSGRHECGPDRPPQQPQRLCPSRRNWRMASTGRSPGPGEGRTCSARRCQGQQSSQQTVVWVGRYDSCCSESQEAQMQQRRRKPSTTTNGCLPATSGARTTNTTQAVRERWSRDAPSGLTDSGSIRTSAAYFGHDDNTDRGLSAPGTRRWPPSVLSHLTQTDSDAAVVVDNYNYDDNYFYDDHDDNGGANQGDDFSVSCTNSNNDARSSLHSILTFQTSFFPFTTSCLPLSFMVLHVLQ